MTTGAPYPYEPPPQRPRTGPTADGTPPPRRRRSLLPLGLVAFAVLEIWLLTLLADATSGLVVLSVLVAGAVLGAAAVKRAGRRAWQGLVETVESLQPDAGARPREASVDRPRGGNGLAMLGGLLLMLPGLISDAAGLLCLFPPTAGLLRRTLEGRLGRTAGPGAGPGPLGDTLRQARDAERQFRIHRPDGKVVQGEVIREDDGGRGDDGGGRAGTR
ncbi:FxsA family membrane protein [Streptomyces sp. TRM 70361]|uniref:FxsA family membrane protein n=1 Tax=Streptomyces sp. TRM 70361 TaxID=3116553 RepID=UPI002E7B86C5|nr:FxsA family membrane protein [Streptomyces sp. TRM 70361]MEE1938918.1 FxsA family membrane protein [Streptomyces sp. TRM 70361]